MPKKGEKKRERKIERKIVNAVVKSARNRKQQRLLPKGTFSKLGSSIGSYFGGPMGSKLGSSAGRWLSKITGVGDYRVNSNTIVNGNGVATFVSRSNGVRIAHREFLADIKGDANFTLLNFIINPGLATTFPWLSQVARNFEEYQMHGLVFQYIPSSGTAISSTSSALGRLVFATSYDVNDPNFTTKQQMESYQYATACVPFETMIHPVECKLGTNVLSRLYVRERELGATEDARFYDLGNFQYAVQGMQSAYTVGELWVSYDVELTKPRIDVSSGGFAHIGESPANTAAKDNFLGTGVSGVYGTVSPQSDSRLVKLDNNKVTIVYPGTYAFYGLWRGGKVSADITAAYGANIKELTTFADDKLGQVTGHDAVQAFINIILVVSAGGFGADNTVTLAGGTDLNGGTCDIMVIPIRATGPVI